MQAIEAKNAGETLAFQVDEQLNTLKDKMSSSDSDELVKKLADLRKVMDSDDFEQIQEKTKELQEVSWRVTQAVYQQTGEEKKDDK